MSASAEPQGVSQMSQSPPPASQGAVLLTSESPPQVSQTQEPSKAPKSNTDPAVKGRAAAHRAAGKKASAGKVGSPRSGSVSTTGSREEIVEAATGTKPSKSRSLFNTISLGFFAKPTKVQQAVASAGAVSAEKSYADAAGAKLTPRFLKLPLQVAAKAGCDTLPVTGGLTCPQVVSLRDTYPIWAIQLDHGAVDPETEYFNAPGWMRNLLDHSASIKFIFYTTTYSLVMITDLQEERVKVPFRQRVQFDSVDSTFDPAVAANTNRAVFYGPADVLASITDVEGVISDNARPRKASRAEGLDAQPPANRLVRGVTPQISPQLTARMLCCTVHRLYSPAFASRRIRVNFKKELSQHERFALGLQLQSHESVAGAFMTGQDLILCMSQPVTTTILLQLKDTDGVFGARSQLKPLDPIPAVGTTPTQREVAQVAPLDAPVEDKTLGPAFLTLVQGPDPTAETWSEIVAHFVAQNVPMIRAGPCNFHATQLRMSRALLAANDGKLFRVSGRAVLLSSTYMSA